jgi:hypothetical protein
MQTGHGIVNGRWDQSERHSCLFDLIRNALEKLAQNEPSDAAQAYEPDLDQRWQRAEPPAAAE